MNATVWLHRPVSDGGAAMATAFSPRERERIRESLLDAALKSAASPGMRHATVDNLAQGGGHQQGGVLPLLSRARSTCF